MTGQFVKLDIRIHTRLNDLLDGTSFDQMSFVHCNCSCLPSSIILKQSVHIICLNEGKLLFGCVYDLYKPHINLYFSNHYFDSDFFFGVYLPPGALCTSILPFLIEHTWKYRIWLYSNYIDEMIEVELLYQR